MDFRPRYFYIQNNEAYEFYSKVDGHKVFSEIEHDPECAILKQNIPEAPQEKSATVICPFKVNNNWSIQEYTEGKNSSKFAPNAHHLVTELHFTLLSSFSNNARREVTMTDDDSL